MVEFFVKEGATSISVNPDKVVETRNMVAAIERKLMLEELANLRERLNNLERKRGSGSRVFSWASDLG